MTESNPVRPSVQPAGKQPAPTGSASTPTPSTDPAKQPSGPLATARQKLGDERTMAFWVGAVLGAVLAAATVLLIVQNRESANLDWLGFDFTAPLWLLLFASAVSGAVLAYVAPPVLRHVRGRAKRRREAGSRGPRRG